MLPLRQSRHLPPQPSVPKRCRMRYCRQRKQAAALATEGYTSGAFDIDNVLLAEQSLADAQLETFRSKAEQARAWALLEHDKGQLP